MCPFREVVLMEVPWRLTTTTSVDTGRVVVLVIIFVANAVVVKVDPGKTADLMI